LQDVLFRFTTYDDILRSSSQYPFDGEWDGALIRACRRRMSEHGMRTSMLDVFIEFFLFHFSLCSYCSYCPCLLHLIYFCYSAVRFGTWSVTIGVLGMILLILAALHLRWTFTEVLFGSVGSASLLLAGGMCMCIELILSRFFVLVLFLCSPLCSFALLAAYLLYFLSYAYPIYPLFFSLFIPFY
jgi:hypothetical protein